jgi:hypothetical protein
VPRGNTSASLATIHRYERGESEHPHEAIVIRIANALEVSPIWLLFGREPRALTLTRCNGSAPGFTHYASQLGDVAWCSQRATVEEAP